MGSRPDVPSSIWRLSNYSDLSGRGGLIASGRWHTRLKAILYCSDEPYTAYTEVLRRFGGSPLLVPVGYRLIEIKVPRNMELEVLDVKAIDPSWSAPGVDGWKICQAIGDEWHNSYRTAMLQVPSVARPNSFNFLINLVHQHSRALSILRVVEQPFPDWDTGFKS